MAGIPSLVGFDFTYGMGAQTPALARLLADAGSQLAKSVETFATRNEAAAKAPVLQQAYASGYAKLAQGDFSGFADLTAASGMAAGNPLLMQMAKEANDLGVHLATNYTQTALAKERYDREDLRYDRARADDTNAFADRMAIQDDSQIAAERARIQKENFDRQERNSKRQRAAQTISEQTGEPYQAPADLEPLLDVPPLTDTVAPRARAVPKTESRSASLKSVRGVPGLPPVEPELPARDAPDNAATQAAAADRQAAAANAVAPATAAPVTAPPTTTPPVSSTRAEEPIHLQLGPIQMDVEKPKGAMKKEGVTVSETGATSTTLKPDSKKEKAYADFVDGVSTMQGISPSAAAFVAKYSFGGKGIEWKTQEENGKVTQGQMYGVDKNGKQVPFTEKGEDGKDQPVNLNRDFYEAHKNAVNAFPVVRDLVKIKTPQEKPQADPMARIKGDEEFLTFVQQRRKELKEGKINEAQFDQAVLREQDRRETRKRAGVDEEGERREKKAESAAKNASKIKDLREQVAYITKQIDEGKTTVAPFSFGFSGRSAAIPDTKLSVTEINKLKLQRDVLLQRIAQLE